MKDDSEVKKFLEDSLANATDDAYRPEDLKAAVKRFLQAEKFSGMDQDEAQEAIAEVAQIAAGLWKTYRKQSL